MAKYQAYAEYKDSGVEWLGKVPKDWTTTRLKYIKSQEQNAFVDGPFGSNLKSEHFIANGDVYVIESNFATTGNLDIDELKTITTKHFESISRSEAKGNDIIIAKIGARYGSSSILPLLSKKAVVSGNSLKLTVNNKICNIKYALHLLQHLKNEGAMDDGVNGSAQPALSLGGLNILPFLLPSNFEQSKIVNFLDHETTKIDHLIEKQQQLIELLKEKRQAVISHAVTKGLNPNVPMKDSGVEWVGKVPEHWTVTKIGFHTLKIGSGKTPKGGAEIYQDEGVLFIRSQNVYNDGLRIDSSESVYISEAIHDDMSTSKVYSGDILLNITGGSIGRSSLVPDGFSEANVNQHVCIIRVRKCLQEFLASVIQSDLIQAQIQSIQTGGNREGLNFEQISKFCFVLPSDSEKKQIISYIKKKLNEFGELEARANKAIQLMQERRTALISAAVTGKIDVRNWQAPTLSEADTELSA